MIVEATVFTGILYGVYELISREPSDMSKIEKTFRNVKYGFGDKYPMRLYKRHYKNYSLYGFSVPYGLTDNTKLEILLSSALNKPVKTELDGHLKVKVYREDLPERMDYDFTKTKGWTVPIGHSLDRLELHDFDKIPHMTIAGMTRQGKTVLLKLIFAHLIDNHPDDVSFHIIDLKGGLEFNQYRNLTQVKSIASNVEEARDNLTDILDEIKAEMQRFKSENYTNVLDTPIKSRKFVIVDEGAELTPPSHCSREEKQTYQYCQQALSEIARIAGALGYRLIFATQYPTSDTLPRQIKQNADAKISFRLPTEVASRVAIDEQGAEELNTVGRAIYRTADKHVVQVPYISDQDIKERLSEYVRAADEETPKRRTDFIEFG